MAFFSKADAKVRLIFELPKLFRSFFQKDFFEAVRFKTSSLFSISTHLRFSLESGCKITALRHILQTSATLFLYFFAVVYVSHWFSKDAVEQIFKAAIPVNKASYLNIYTRARIYRGFPKTTCISYTGKTSCRLTINNGVWYTGYFLHSSYTTKKMTAFLKNMTAFLKKATAFKKNAVIFQSQHPSAGKSNWCRMIIHPKHLPANPLINGCIKCRYFRQIPWKKNKKTFGLYYKLNYICKQESGKKR